MYNILITDDEQIVIDSLMFIINKNFPSQVTLFSALSGADALDITTKQQIDIIFMDINMPGMNGLETVKCIKQIKPNTVIIILSAFDRFQYAQEAINLGAYKYITKPVNRNLVIQTVRGAMNLVDSKHGQSADDEELQRKLDFVSPMVESDFIYSCAFSNDKDFDLHTYLDYFNIRQAAWCFSCLEVPLSGSTNQYHTYTSIRDILNAEHRCLIGSFMLNRLVIFFPVELDSPIETSSERLHEEFKKIYTLLSLKVMTGIRIGVSKIESDVTKTAALYNEALAALNRTPTDGGIVFADCAHSPESTLSQTGKILEQLFNRLRIGDAGGVRSLVISYCDSLFDSDIGIDKIKNALFELLVNARNITTEITDSYDNTAFDSSFSVLSKENQKNALEEFVQKRLLECTIAITNARTSHENPIIKKVCNYINEHLSQDISLDQIAEIGQVSTFYLSKLFKEEKGETYSNYISDMRLEKAKLMLSTTTVSIKEISAEVGYNDQNYFSKLFKNKFGVTPTEFRDANSNGGNS